MKKNTCFIRGLFIIVCIIAVYIFTSLGLFWRSRRAGSKYNMTSINVQQYNTLKVSIKRLLSNVFLSRKPDFELCFALRSGDLHVRGLVTETGFL